MIELAEIETARVRIAGAAIRTPLLRLHVADAPAEIYIKCESLQPIVLCEHDPRHRPDYRTSR